MSKPISFLQRHKKIILLLFLAFLVRIIPAFLFAGGFDSAGTEEVYYKFLKTGKGKELFSIHTPLLFCFVWLVGRFSEFTGISVSTVARFPAIFSDLMMALLIYKVFLNLGFLPEKSSNLAAAYALNPITIIVSSINGNYDSLTMLFCVLAWYFYVFGKTKMVSAFFLGIGVIIKEFPAVLFPVFWGRLRQLRERAGYIGYFLLPIFITLSIAYFMGTLGFIIHLLKYNSSTGFWGISLISKYLANRINNSFFVGLNFFVEHFFRYISLIVVFFIWGLCFRKKTDIVNSILLIFTTIYFVAPGFGAQYFVWILPFAVIAKDRMLKPYTFFVSIVLILWFIPVLITGDPSATYNSIRWLNFTRNLFSVFGWFITGVWMYKLLRIHV